MADNPKRSVEYIPELGISYVDNGDGSATYAQGDLSKDPRYNPTLESTGPRLKPNAAVASKMKTTGKDLMVNIASQLPLAIPGVGLPARLALSGVAGLGADRIAEPERPMDESVGEAAINTLLGSITEGLAGGTLKTKMPHPRIDVGASTRFGKLWFGLQGMSPVYRDLNAVAPGSDVLELLKNVPAAATRGPRGQSLTNAALAAARNAKSAAEKKIVVDATKNLLKYNLIPGVAANEIFDLTLNEK